MTLATAKRRRTKSRKPRCALRPTGDRVVVSREDQEEVSPGGIVLPDQAQEKKQLGTVLAIGPGKLLPDGSRANMFVKVGDKVVFGVYAETVTIRDEEFILLREDDIYAILEPEEDV